MGQYSVKFASLNPENGRMEKLRQLVLYPERQSREETLSPDEICRRLSAFVKKCQQEGGDCKSSVKTAVQGEDTICRYLELPPLSRKELEVAIPSQAMKFIPFPMNSVSLSWTSVPPVNPADKKNAIFFVAAQKKTVEEITGYLKTCGFDISRIETPVLPLVREFSRNCNYPRDAFQVLIQAGDRFTNLVVLRDHFPYYAREFSLAGRDFTYALQMGSQCSWNEAEEAKRSCDAGGSEVSLEPFLLRWMAEVKKSIDFFKSQFSEISPRLDGVFLSGGSAYLKNLDRRLSAHLELPVQVSAWNRLEGDQKDADRAGAAALKVAVGLALED
jgi:type IV pilus assembly protein PilM